MNEATDPSSWLDGAERLERKAAEMEAEAAKLRAKAQAWRDCAARLMAQNAAGKEGRA